MKCNCGGTFEEDESGHYQCGECGAKWRELTSIEEYEEKIKNGVWWCRGTGTL